MDVGTNDRRTELADWLTSKDNPYFAKSLVNRYWSYFLGRGIIDPVDDIRAGNPPSNPELLDALTADFVAHNFDLKHLDAHDRRFAHLSANLSHERVEHRRRDRTSRTPIRAG